MGAGAPARAVLGGDGAGPALVVVVMVVVVGQVSWRAVLGANGTGTALVVVVVGVVGQVGGRWAGPGQAGPGRAGQNPENGNPENLFASKTSILRWNRLFPTAFDFLGFRNFKGFRPPRHGPA